MDAFISADLALRWLHVLFGIVWIGLLYYFNFVQTEYFKEAEPLCQGRRRTKAGASRAVVVPLGSDVHLPDGSGLAALHDEPRRVEWLHHHRCTDGHPDVFERLADYLAQPEDCLRHYPGRRR